jgi:hypothetical protein
VNVILCDFELCAEDAVYHVQIVDDASTWRGLEFDTCSLEHIPAYIDEIEKSAASLQEASS